MTTHNAVLSIFTMAAILTHASGCASSHDTNSQWTTDESVHDNSLIAASEAQTSFEIDSLDALRDTLLDQYERDQALRTQYSETFSHSGHDSDEGHATPDAGKELLSQLWAIDQESTQLIRAMMDQYGWPSYDMIGEDAAKAAWLLAQHADAEPELQERALQLMRPLVEQSQADSKLYAMLIDRVLMNKGEPQIYGTQFAIDDEGVFRPLPVEDFEHIDARRTEMGFGSIKEYADYFSSVNGSPADTKPHDEYPAYNFNDPEECESDEFHNHP